MINFEESTISQLLTKQIPRLECLIADTFTDKVTIRSSVNNHYETYNVPCSTSTKQILHCTTAEVTIEVPLPSFNSLKVHMYCRDLPDWLVSITATHPAKKPYFTEKELLAMVKTYGLYSHYITAWCSTRGIQLDLIGLNSDQKLDQLIKLIFDLFTKLNSKDF